MQSLSQAIENIQTSNFTTNSWVKVIVLLTLLVFSIYGNTALNGYSIDDNLIVDGNQQAEQGFSGVKEILTTNYFSRGAKRGSYRAIPRATFAVEIGFFGKNPGVSHIINTFLFLFTCLLVFKLLLQLFPRGHLIAILFTVLLFAVHPLHTEVVASLKNRDELMQLLFSLVASVSLVHYARNGKIVSILISSFSFLIALACKESAVQFLAVFPILFYYAGTTKKKRGFVVVASFLAVVLGFGAFQVFVLNPDAILWMDAAKDEFPFIEHPLMHTSNVLLKFGTALCGLGYYLKLFIAPYPLGFFYGYNQIEIVSVFTPTAIGAAIAYGWLLFAGFKGLKSRSLYALGILIMLICLSIFSNLIIQVSGIIAERFAYSSSLGFCILLGWVVQTAVLGFKSTGRAITLTVGSLVLGLFSIMTIERNTHWKNYLTLATHDARVFTESAITHFYLGMYVENDVLDTAQANREDWWRKAAFEYSEVSRIHPPTTSASLYAANIYINELKNQDSALIMFDRWYQNVNEINEPGPLNSYGMCLSNANRPDEALEIFRKTTAAFQNNEVSYKQAAELLFNQGKKEALLALMNKLEFNIPSSDLPRIYRANLAMRDGNEALAIQYFADALKLKPENSELRQHLIQLYTANGMMEKAAALK